MSGFLLTIIISYGLFYSYLRQMKESLIYPGVYTPLYSLEPLLSDLIISKKDSSIQPLINMDEYEDHYNLDIMMPGVTREQIIIYYHKSILSIGVINIENTVSLNKEIKIHEFDSNHFQRHIPLPKNADKVFITAELKAGVLRIHIPKSDRNITSNAYLVIVY